MNYQEIPYNYSHYKSLLAYATIVECQLLPTSVYKNCALLWPWLCEFSVASPSPDVVSADFPGVAASAAVPAVASYSEHFAPALRHGADSAQEG